MQSTKDDSSISVFHDTWTHVVVCDAESKADAEAMARGRMQGVWSGVQVQIPLVGLEDKAAQKRVWWRSLTYFDYLTVDLVFNFAHFIKGEKINNELWGRQSPLSPLHGSATVLSLFCCCKVWSAVTHAQSAAAAGLRSAVFLMLCETPVPPSHVLMVFKTFVADLFDYNNF